MRLFSRRGATLGVLVVICLSIVHREPVRAQGVVPGGGGTGTVLTVTGALDGGPRSFDLEALRALGLHDLRTATPWTDGRPTFTGPHLADVLRAAGARGSRIRAKALNAYVIDIPADDAERHGVIVALYQDGQRLTVRTKGPAWLLYPLELLRGRNGVVYEMRCVWQLSELEILD